MKAIALSLASMVALLGACRSTPAGVGLARWTGLRFSAQYPAGWVPRVTGDRGVTFDGTRPLGVFRQGRTLEITREDSPLPSSSRFDSGCGSHGCQGRLTVTSGVHRLVLTDDCGTDWCPDEAVVERELRSLAEQVLPTIRDL